LATDDEPVLVDDGEVVEHPQVVTDGVVSVIWLHRLDDFLRRWRHVSDFLFPPFIEAISTWTGFGHVDRELAAARMLVGQESELPDEVIEAKAQIVNRIADEYAKTHDGRAVDFDAPDVVPTLRVDFLDPGIRFSVLGTQNLRPQRVQMLTCSGQFCLGAIERGHMLPAGDAQ
jgi:hypothetical protein